MDEARKQLLALETDMGVPAPDRLKIHLSLHTLDRVVKELVPFFGGACPVAVIYSNNDGRWIVRSTLGEMESGELELPSVKSSAIVVG